MRVMYFDLETIQAERAKPVDMSKITAPANYKDPAKISAYRIDKAHEQMRTEWEESALDPMRGSICCISSRIVGEDTVTEVGDEELLLTSFHKRIEAGLEDHGSLVMVGFNSQDFDIPYFMRRAMHHGLYDLTSRVNRMPKKDLRRLWAMGEWHKYMKGTLRDVARFLGWEGGDDIPGSEVTARFRIGDYESIELHASQDVDATAHIGACLARAGFLTEAT